MSSIISLKDRHTDATRELILATAIELLEKAGVTDLTVRSVAKAAGMSERKPSNDGIGGRMTIGTASPARAEAVRRENTSLKLNAMIRRPDAGP